MAKSKEPIWTPPEDVVRELLDAAAEKIPEDAIYHAEVVKPAAEPLRDLVNGYLAFSYSPANGQAAGNALTKERIFACLKNALIKADGEHKMRKSIRESYEREEKRSEERLDILKTVAREMVESYGSSGKVHTPLGDLRMQRNSSPFVWVDLDRIDEIPEKIGEFQLVKVEKTPSKTGIGAYLEDLEQQGQPKPDWAEIKEPGFHIRYS